MRRFSAFSAAIVIAAALWLALAPTRAADPPLRIGFGMAQLFPYTDAKK